MAITALRLRRAVPLARELSTYSHLSFYSSAAVIKNSPATPFPTGHRHLCGFNHQSLLASRWTVSRCRVSNSGSVYSPLDSNSSGERPTLFPGCDYNHWLVTMEWPDPQPTREEKIDCFVKTLANVVGSEEEAKKRIYALSTTTYQGFMCEISEELSEKIKKEPGVEWVLPDSYGDPINKTYGVGDKYINGVIIPDTKIYNNRSTGRDRPRNRRRDSMPVERRDVQVNRNPLPPVDVKDTTVEMSMKGDGQDQRSAVDGRSPFTSNQQDHGLPPMSGRGQDYRTPTMDGRGSDYRPPPIDGRGQDYRTPPMDGRGQDYRPPPVDGRGQDYRSPPIDGRGQAYRSPSMDGTGQGYMSMPMNGRGQDYRSPPIEGRGQEYYRPPSQMEGHNGYYSPSPVEGRGQDYYRPQPRDVRGSDYYTPPPIDGTGQDYRSPPMQGRWQDYRPPPMDGRGQDYRPPPMDGRGQDYRSPPVDGRGQDYRSPQMDGGRMQGYYNQPPVASGQGQDYYRPPPMDGVSGQDYRPSALDGRGQDYRSSMDRRDPVPSGDWQGHRASMDGRGPTMQEDQQGNRSPVNSKGPILGEGRDFVPPREVMQGQQSNIMGPERNTPGQRTEVEPFPWPIEGTN